MAVLHAKPNPRPWSDPEIRVLWVLSETLRTFYADLSADAKNYTAFLVQQLDARRTEHKGIYSATLEGIKNEIGYRPQDD